MSRPRHPDQDIEKAIRYGESLGWTVRMSKKGHSWGFLLCANHDRQGCWVAIHSTSRSASNHANQIIRKIDRCPHDPASANFNGDDDDGDSNAG